MAQPKLSVTMCNYNHGAYVGEALGAVLGQTRPPDEIVVVDDASTDHSLEVLRPLAAANPTIKLLVNEKNLGVGKSAVRAASNVSGEFLACPTADDVLDTRFFERSLDLLEAHPQAALAVGCVNDLYPDGRLVYPTFQAPTVAALPEPTYVTPQRAFQLERALVPLGLLGYASVYRRDLYMQTMPHNPRADYLGDWFYLRVLAFRHGFCFVPEVSVKRRMLEGSISDHARRSWAVRRTGLVELLAELQTRFPETLPAFRDSGAFAAAGYQAVAWMLTRPEYRHMITARLCLRGLLNLYMQLIPDPVKTRLRRLQAGLRRRR